MLAHAITAFQVVPISVHTRDTRLDSNLLIVVRFIAITVDDVAPESDIFRKEVTISGFPIRVKQSCLVEVGLGLFPNGIKVSVRIIVSD